MTQVANHVTREVVAINRHLITPSVVSIFSLEGPILVENSLFDLLDAPDRPTDSNGCAYPIVAQVQPFLKAAQLFL